MKHLAIAVLFLSSITVNAQNWPSFRGPNASGVAEGTNPPVTWDLEKSQNVLWKTNIPGLSHSSPIVWGNNIFVITAVSSEAKPTFKAKDRGIGLANERNEITSWTTPTIYQGKDRVELIANGGRFIRGYDPLTGKELWRFADNDTQVKMQAPLIANDLIYITGGYPPGRAMYAFRPGAVGDISLKSGEDKNAFLAWSTSKGSPLHTNADHLR